MTEEGLQPQLLFTDLVMDEEERAALLRAVVKAEPTFCPPPQAPKPVNTCVLLKHIYSKVSPRWEARFSLRAPGGLTCRRGRLVPRTGEHPPVYSGFSCCGHFLS